jgi:hypothetical protein
VQQFRFLLNRKLSLASQKQFGGKTTGRRIFDLPPSVYFIEEFASMSRLCRV